MPERDDRIVKIYKNIYEVTWNCML
jgi:hypothetical protein